MGASRTLCRLVQVQRLELDWVVAMQCQGRNTAVGASEASTVVKWEECSQAHQECTQEMVCVGVVVRLHMQLLAESESAGVGCCMASSTHVTLTHPPLCCLSLLSMHVNKSQCVIPPYLAHLRTSGTSTLLYVPIGRL